MFLAIFSNERTVGLGVSDITILVDSDNEDEATEIADEYAEENGIKYAVLDVIDLDDLETI
jgi:hypothetical protein